MKCQVKKYIYGNVYVGYSFNFFDEWLMLLFSFPICNSTYLQGIFWLYDYHPDVGVYFISQFWHLSLTQWITPLQISVTLSYCTLLHTPSLKTTRGQSVTVSQSSSVEYLKSKCSVVFQNNSDSSGIIPDVRECLQWAQGVLGWCLNSLSNFTSSFPLQLPSSSYRFSLLCGSKPLGISLRLSHLRLQDYPTEFHKTVGTTDENSLGWDCSFIRGEAIIIYN